MIAMVVIADIRRQAEARSARCRQGEGGILGAWFAR